MDEADDKWKHNLHYSGNNDAQREQTGSAEGESVGSSTSNREPGFRGKGEQVHVSTMSASPVPLSSNITASPFREKDAVDSTFVSDVTDPDHRAEPPLCPASSNDEDDGASRLEHQDDEDFASLSEPQESRDGAPRCDCMRAPNRTLVIFVIVSGFSVLAVTLGVLLTTRPPSNSSAPPNDFSYCALDREALVRCESGIIEVPECAGDAFEKLLLSRDIMPGSELSCDAANYGLVALAVAQTFHGELVVDPELFFAFSTFYFSLEGLGWRQDRNWALGSSPCEDFWYGVNCSPGGLITIDLEANGLRGTLPTEIGLISNLQILDIRRNENITGSIPSQLGLLTRLLRLDLSRLNRRGAFVNWESTDSGSVPSELGNLTSLTELNLSGIGLTGTFPLELGGLTKLENVDLSFNPNLTGSLPSGLCALKSAGTLVLDPCGGRVETGNETGCLADSC